MIWIFMSKGHVWPLCTSMVFLEFFLKEFSLYYKVGCCSNPVISVFKHFLITSYDSFCSSFKSSFKFSVYVYSLLVWNSTILIFQILFSNKWYIIWYIIITEEPFTDKLKDVLSRDVLNIDIYLYKQRLYLYICYK